MSFRSLVCGALLLLGTTAAIADDVVMLKNGDRLSGTIGALLDGTLSVETAWAGKVAVKWSEVARVQTATPARFRLRDGTLLEALASPGEAESTAVLKSGEIITTAPIALADIEYINPPPEVIGEGVAVSGRVNLGFNAARGNTDNSQLHYDAETIVRSVDNRFTLGAAGETKEEEGVETARRNRAYLKYDHFLSKKLYAYTNGDFEEDKFKDLNLRSTLGAGFGHQFFESPLRNLALEGGLTYVNNDYIEADDESYAAARWAVRYDQFLFGTSMQFFHVHEGLLSVEDPEDLIFRSQTGLRFPLIERLNATLQYNLDWRNNPPGDTESTDSIYILGLGYTW